MKFKSIFQIYVSILFALSGCATMNSDNTRTISIQSTPPGATVYYREESTPLGVTPGKITLLQYMYSEPVITLKKAGYKNVYIPIETNFSWSTLMNVYNFGVGFIVDASSGNVVHISDTSKVINITLQPLSESATESTVHIQAVASVIESASESKL